MSSFIPLVDLAAQHLEVADDLVPAMLDVLSRGAFVGGAAVSEFEKDYARYISTEHCVGVANGTDAIEIALRAVGVRAGGEVVIPANTFIATAGAVARIGAVPVLVDVDDRYHLMDPDLVGEALSSKTQAVVPVHLFGQAAPVERIEAVLAASGIPIVEDAAQSQGARRHSRPAGSLGRAAGTSFYPGKNLGAAGDAGAILTDDDDVEQASRLMSNHGSRRKYVHEVPGFNSRLDALQAVVLSAKLRRLDAWNDCRRVAAARYDELLADIPAVRLPATMPGNEHVWHLYVVRVPRRDAVLAALNEQGIGAGIHYPDPVHGTPAFAHLAKQGSLPVAEKAATEILSLPLHPHITADQQERVSVALREILSKV